MIRRLLMLLAALALLGPASAIAAEPRASLTDIEDEVMCPVCGTPLNVSEAPLADDQREYIRDLIDQGLTKEQIKAALVRDFGEEVLATPGDDGIDLAVWLVPAVLLLVALAGLAVALPRWRRSTAEVADAAPPSTPPLDPDDARRLDADLARYDS